MSGTTKSRPTQKWIREHRQRMEELLKDIGDYSDAPVSARIPIQEEVIKAKGWGWLTLDPHLLTILLLAKEHKGEIDHATGSKLFHACVDTEEKENALMGHAVFTDEPYWRVAETWAVPWE